ncbi:hypothetical protein H8D30_02695 [bacterium]|nr:hypothetical protein [bacterium]
MQVDNKVATLVIVLVVAVLGIVVWNSNKAEASTSGTLAGEAPTGIALGQ